MKKGTQGITVGEILLEDYLKPMGLSPYRLARELHVSLPRVYSILKGNRTVTVDTALRLGAFFKTGPEFWLNLQSLCDLRQVREKKQEQKILKEIHPFDQLKRVAA
jgi:addiction module HigA family antidote